MDDSLFAAGVVAEGIGEGLLGGATKAIELHPVLTGALLVATAVFGAAAVLATAKIIRGPSILDRMIGTDVLLATMLCALGAYVVTTGHQEMLPVLLCIAAFSFIGSVAVSRYVTRNVTVSEYGTGSNNANAEAATVGTTTAGVDVGGTGAVAANTHVGSADSTTTSATEGGNSSTTRADDADSTGRPGGAV